MNMSLIIRAHRLLLFGLFAVLFILVSPGARAGLTFNVDVYRNNHGTFFNFYMPISTNTTAPEPAVGVYFISSPQWPTNGSTRAYEMTASGFNPNPISGHETGYGDYASMMQQITNGNWTILFTNATTTNLFTFTVSAPNMNSNRLPSTVITYPSEGAINIPNQPTFTWLAPANWVVPTANTYFYNYDFSFFEVPDPIPANQTNWTDSTPFPNGLNCTFNLNYVTNYATPLFVATTPLNTNASHQAICGWISTSTLESGDAVSFAITNPPAVGTPLVAHYTFDNSGNIGQDSSGNGNDLNFNGGDGVASSGTAKAGAGAAYFDGGSFFAYTNTPSTILSAFAGDFSLSFWIRTTQNDGNENGPGWAGTGLVSADVPGSYYDLIPAALDGGQIGFNTGPYDDTLNTTVDVNDGHYHHIVITRNQSTGEKQIYVDGALKNSDSATPNPLTDPRSLAIGCKIDASQANPANFNPSRYFNGLLDDIQIYSGVLSPLQVAQLYTSPGSTLAVAPNFNAALNTTNLVWTTTGDTDWFVESTNTYDGVSAAQSGRVSNSQSSTLSVTVTGPGTLTFYWSSIANDPHGGFDFEFDLDGSYLDNISGNTSWHQEGPFTIDVGPHTLTWTVSANGDTDRTQAGFLDLVSGPPPSIYATASQQSGPAPLTVQFVSDSADSLGNAVTSWNWAFGDGGASTAQNPVHTYTNSGSYPPSLVVLTAGGGSPAVIGPGVITVTNTTLGVTASPQSGPAPLTVQFTCPSVDSSGDTVTNWAWNFGDGGTSTAQNPTHTYASIGSYSPRLAAKSAGAVPLVTGPGAIYAIQPQSTFNANLPGPSASFAYNNFNNARSLLFNGHAASVTNGNGPVLELTPSGSAQSGSAFTGNPIALTPYGGFSTFFAFRLGNPASGSPGDGITFTLQGISPFALGNGGAGDSNITNSLNVEFDAFNRGTQSSTPGGINTNQIAININGAASDLAAAPVTNSMNNGNIWYAWIDYSGVSQRLETRLAEVPIRPLTPTLTATVNLASILGSTNIPLSGQVLVNGGFENEPNWAGGVSYDGGETALVGNELPGWTVQPGHAVTIHTRNIYLVISGQYGANADGEGYNGHNANFYQDFNSGLIYTYTLSFNWQSWGLTGVTPQMQLTKLKVSVADTVTGGVLFTGLYSYDTSFGPVHLVTTNFFGTGNPLRLRIEETPETGVNDNMFVVDNFSVVTSQHSYVNAYAGFTGIGGNQQDVLSWKFTALPTMHLTGHCALTNVSPNFQLTNGLVAKSWAYRVNSIWFTNFNLYPVTFIVNADGSEDYDSGPVDSPIPPFEFQAPPAMLNDNLEADLLSQYTDIGAVSGMNVALGNGPSNQALLQSLTGEGWSIAFPGVSEADMQGWMQIINSNNSDPGTITAIYNFEANPTSSATPLWPFLQSENDDGDYNYADDTWSVGQQRGTVVGREQLIYTPPWPLVMLSPRTDSAKFIFDFHSVNKQSYTVWGNSNLATTNWISHTNLIGDGYMQKITVPLTNGTQGFFHVTSP